MKWTADVFDIEYKETRNLNTAIDLLKDNYYIIVSCNEGLFTYGGHFIVIVGLENDTLKIYDPYLYNGKFNTSSRKGKASIKSNTVYVTKSNFKKYANARMFYCYKNDRTDVKENNTTVTVNKKTKSSVKNVNYKVKVTANSGLNIRNGASTKYKRVGTYAKNATVTITKESNGWGKTNKGWICLKYTKKVNTSKSKTYTVKVKKRFEYQKWPWYKV